MVDDGSPDHSGAICDDYARKDDRIKVFHKLNGGVSSARQYGIDHAIGEYVIHADPDDWVESSMLEELYNKAKEEDADMVICDYYMNYENKQVYKKQEPSSLDHRTVLKELFQQLMAVVGTSSLGELVTTIPVRGFPRVLHCGKIVLFVVLFCLRI
mgnify:CR=1 FL=1